MMTCTLKATVAEVEENRVILLLKDGRNVEVFAGDLRDDLRYVGMPVSLVHDKNGFVTEIRGRPAEPLPDDVRRSVAEIIRWADTL